MLYRTSKDKNHPYVILNKGFLEDGNLSLKAKGLLAYCMSKPDGWVFHISQMITVLKEGRDALNAAFNELIKYGYCERSQKREQGKFDKGEYTLYETPIRVNANEKITEKPYTENPVTVNPSPENPQLVNNDSILNNEKQQQQQAAVVIEPMKGFLAKFSETHGEYWKVSDEVLSHLVSAYGKGFVEDQLTSITKKHIQAIKDEAIPHKKNKSKRIENPESYLKLSCADNWACSRKKKE